MLNFVEINGQIAYVLVAVSSTVNDVNTFLLYEKSLCLKLDDEMRQR